MGRMVTLHQRPLYGNLISELIYQTNHTICFCLAMTKSKINQRIWIPYFLLGESGESIFSVLFSILTLN